MKSNQQHRLISFQNLKVLLDLPVRCRLRVLGFVKNRKFSTYVKNRGTNVLHVRSILRHCLGYFENSSVKNRKIYFLNFNFTLVISTHLSMAKNKEILDKYFVPYSQIYKLHISPTCEIDHKKLRKCRRFLKQLIPLCRRLKKLDYGIGQVLDSAFLKKISRVSNLSQSLIKINVHDGSTFGKSLELFPNLRYVVKWKDEPLRGNDLVSHSSIRRLKSTPDNESFRYILQNKSLREVRLYVEHLSPDNIEKLFGDPKFEIIKTANMKEHKCFSSIARNSTLREISFSFMSMKDHRYLMQFISLNRSLSTVWIDNSEISDKDVLLLMKRPLVEHLKRLNLAKNKITGESCIGVFYDNQILEELNLSGNPMGKLGVEKISEFFSRNKGITDLDISDTRLNVDHQKVIDSVVKGNQTLVSLEVHYSEELFKSIMKDKSETILQITCHFYSKQRVTQEWIRGRDRANVGYFGSASQVKREEMKAKRKQIKEQNSKVEFGIPEEAFQKAIEKRKIQGKRKYAINNINGNKSSKVHESVTTTTRKGKNRLPKSKNRKKNNNNSNNQISSSKNKTGNGGNKGLKKMRMHRNSQKSTENHHHHHHHHSSSNSVVESEVILENRNHIQRLLRRAEKLCYMKQYNRAISEASHFCKVRKDLSDQERKEIKKEIAMTLQKNDALFLVTCVRCRKIVLDIKRCSRCKRSYYCSREHQIEDWTDHKPMCLKRSLAQKRRLLLQEQEEEQKQQQQQNDDDDNSNNIGGGVKENE